MQVHVDAVEAHITGTDMTHDSVQVRAVVVTQAAGLMDQPRNFQDILVENADGIGVRQHKTRDVGA